MSCLNEVPVQSIEPLLKEFESFCFRFPSKIPWAVHFTAEGPPPLVRRPHLVIGVLIHGNECGSLPGALVVLRQLELHRPKIDVTFILGNPHAAERDLRFIESDLNRAFADDARPTLEVQRAQELKRVLSQADLFLDLHQTSMPCVEPFYIFGFDPESYLWARAIGGARVFVTRPGNEVYEPGLMCGDEYVRSLKRPAVTLELGQRGLNGDAAALSERVVLKTIALMTELFLKSYKSIESVATRNQALQFFERRLKIPFRDAEEFVADSFCNLTTLSTDAPLVKCRDTVTKRWNGPTGARVLFPKYPERDTNGVCTEPLLGDLIQVLVPIRPYKF